jgi:hypothetical protein
MFGKSKSNPTDNNYKSSDSEREILKRISERKQ